jgi:hypothetical protein
MISLISFFLITLYSGDFPSAIRTPEWCYAQYNLFYVGLGVYIIVKSSCYPWSIQHIDVSTSTHPGKTIMAVVTTFLLLTCMGVILSFKLRKRVPQPTPDVNISGVGNPSPTPEGADAVDSSHTPA